MSIAKRIEEALSKMDAGDFEGALIPASIAVDATANQEYPNVKNNTAYKNFIHDNFAIISKVSSGGTVTIGNLLLKYNHPDIIPNQDGTCSIEQILYHVVRCGLLHKATLPSNLRFIADGIIEVKDDLLILPAGFIYGLLAAVVVSPSNKEQFISSTSVYKIKGCTIPINDLWGKKEKLLEPNACQFESKSQSRHQEANIGALQQSGEENDLNHKQAVNRKVNTQKYNNFLENCVNDIDKLFANAKARARFREQIKILCEMVETYGQMLNNFGRAAEKEYTSKDELQRAEKEAKEAQEELAKIEDKWPEIYQKHGESEITRNLADRCRELRNMCDPFPASKAYRDGPPDENYTWNNYWDNEYVKCPWDAFWPVFWRPPKPVNPLWWFPYSRGNSTRLPNDSEKLMRDYVLLAIIHDECLKAKDAAARFIYKDNPYNSTYFERDRFFGDLWENLESKSENKSLIERALMYVKNDVTTTRNVISQKQTITEFIPYEIDIMEDIAKNLKSYTDNAPRNQTLTNEQLFKYQINLVKCFGRFNYAMIWLRNNKYRKDADILENQRRKVLDDIREMVNLTQNGSNGFWPDKVTIGAENLRRKLEDIAKKARENMGKRKKIWVGFKELFFKLWEITMKSFFDSAMNR